ncbi:hypothetical protein DFH29DRAFT_1009183 [Suillus ampliporus]|nr:hypothetical protein DFH29DRAFT_1009183 [Suillus ampliporus]
MKDSERDDIDTDVADDSNAELEALDSHGSTIFSQPTNCGSDNEFNGSYLFHAVQWALHNRTGYPPKLPFDISPIERYWSAEFPNSPIPDPYNTQKPDVALFYYANKLQEKRWADVLSFVEHTSSSFATSHDLAVYCGSTTKAYLIMQEQSWCRFILAYSICADKLRAHYFDRSGLIISLLTPIHAFPIHVTEAIATTTLADPQYFGLNPTIHMCIADCQGTHPAVGAKGWVVNNSSKTYSIMDVLWKSQGFFCHGTVCYRVRDPTDRKDYVMKDCWVPEAKRYHEAAVLKDLSPNNFIIHEGIGYFIDFDHAGFIEEGKTSTISFGTGTIPCISMRVLKMMLRNAETVKKTTDTTQLQLIEHHACNDLESMFYIFLNLL